MLDYGCGEALSADHVAEPVSRLILCEPAPNVRVMLGARFAGNNKIAVRKPEDIPVMPAHSMDVIVMHSVAQYLSPQRIRRAGASVPSPAQARRAAGGGRRDPAQASRRSPTRGRCFVSAVRRAFTGRRCGVCSAPVFSDYRRLRKSLGLTRYDPAEITAKLENAGFTVEPARYKHRPQ